MDAGARRSVLTESDLVSRLRTGYSSFLTGTLLAVQFHLVIAFKIAGLIGAKHTATDVTTANCPIELSQTSV